MKKQCWKKPIVTYVGSDDHGIPEDNTFRYWHKKRSFYVDIHENIPKDGMYRVQISRKNSKFPKDISRWGWAEGYSGSNDFKTKVRALKFAKDFMKEHNQC